MTRGETMTAMADPRPTQPNPPEVPTGEPVGIPQPDPDVIDPGVIDPAIGIPTGPSPTPNPPGTPGAPLSPGGG